LLAHPLTLLLVTAVVSGLLVPRLTQQWQDHQQQLDTRRDFAARVSRTVGEIFIATQLVEVARTLTFTPWQVVTRLYLPSALPSIAELTITAVPELAILPRLPKMLPRLFGWGVEVTITHALQRTTTWLAATILRVPHAPTTLYMPSVTLEVIPDCSGRETLYLMLVVAGLLAAVMLPRRRPLAGALLVVAAIVVALEANAVRVAGIAIGLEWVAGAFELQWKNWIQYATTATALVQLVWFARIASRLRCYQS